MGGVAAMLAGLVLVFVGVLLARSQDQVDQASRSGFTWTGVSRSRGRTLIIGGVGVVIAGLLVALGMVGPS